MGGYPGQNDCSVRLADQRVNRENRTYRRISRDGRDQRSSRCATSVPEGERTELRIFVPGVRDCSRPRRCADVRVLALSTRNHQSGVTVPLLPGGPPQDKPGGRLRLLALQEAAAAGYELEPVGEAPGLVVHHPGPLVPGAAQGQGRRRDRPARRGSGKKNQRKDRRACPARSSDSRVTAGCGTAVTTALRTTSGKAASTWEPIGAPGPRRRAGTDRRRRAPGSLADIGRQRAGIEVARPRDLGGRVAAQPPCRHPEPSPGPGQPQAVPGMRRVRPAVQQHGQRPAAPPPGKRTAARWP